MGIIIENHDFFIIRGYIFTMKTSKGSEESQNKAPGRSNGFDHKSTHKTRNQRERHEDRFDKDYLSEADLDKIRAIS